MTDHKLPYLSREDCEGLGITTFDVIEMMERLIRGAAAGSVFNAPKSVVMPGDGRYLMATLCVAADPPFMAVKSLGLNPDNSARGLPQINAVVALHDAVSGVPVAMVEGNWVTEVRTAGLSAVAAKYLARGDARSIGFIGCGAQARSHLDAFRQMFAIEEVRALGRGKANRDRFCADARAAGLAAHACDDPREAVDGVDIVVSSVTLSYDTEPFLDARWLEPGAFAAITDLGIPWLDAGMPAFDRVVIDDVEQEKTMAKPLVADALVDGDLTGLVSGAVASRGSDDERTAFVFRGLSLGDLALAALAYQRYRA